MKRSQTAAHILLAISISLLTAGVVSVTEAIVDETPDNERKFLSYATRYFIHLRNLKQPLSLDEIKDAKTFEVMDKHTGKAISATAVQSGTLKPGEKKYMFVDLYGDFRPDAVYRVIIHYPGGEYDDLSTKPLETSKKSPLLLEWFVDRASFSLQPMAG